MSTSVTPTPTQEVARELAAALVRYAGTPCCDVPLSQENPLCVWHGFRSLNRQLAEAFVEARRVETQAQLNALRFFRDTALTHAAQRALTSSVTASETLTYLLGEMNHLLEQIEG